MKHQRIRCSLGVTLGMAACLIAGCDKMPDGKLPEQATEPVLDPVAEEHKRLLLKGLGDPSLSILDVVTYRFSESFTCGSVSTKNDGVRKFIVRGDEAFAAKTRHGDEFVEACCRGLDMAYSSGSGQEELLQRANSSCAVIAKASTNACHGEWPEFKTIGAFLDAYDSPTWLDTEFKIVMHAGADKHCHYRLYKEMGDGHKEQWELRRDGQLFMRAPWGPRDSLGSHYIITADGLEIRGGTDLISIAKSLPEGQ
jgi:hypothetical protein